MHEKKQKYYMKRNKNIIQKETKIDKNVSRKKVVPKKNIIYNMYSTRILFSQNRHQDFTLLLPPKCDRTERNACTISLYKLTNVLLLFICFKLVMKFMKLC